MDATPGLKLQPRTVRTLVFLLAYPLWIYAFLSLVLRLGLSKTSSAGLLISVGAGAAGCALAWLVVRPAGIRWFRWPWWSYALLALGWFCRAWLLAKGGHPWPWVAATFLFYLLAVAVQEEFIFRGCIEEGLVQFGPWPAVIVAGLFYGLSHAPLAILQGDSTLGAVISPLGGGLLYHLAMRWLRDKGGLAFPVLIHGLMDFIGAR